MNAREVLAQYHRLQETTRHMLLAAQEGDWERLVNLEIGRRDALDGLAAREIDFGGNALKEERDDCIREILETDARIRALAEAWMAEMRQMLASVQSQRRIERAYQGA